MGDLSTSGLLNTWQIFSGGDFRRVSVTVYNNYIMLFKKMFTFLEVLQGATTRRQKPGLQITQFPLNKSPCSDWFAQYCIYSPKGSVLIFPFFKFLFTMGSDEPRQTLTLGAEAAVHDRVFWYHVWNIILRDLGELTMLLQSTPFYCSSDCRIIRSIDYKSKNLALYFNRRPAYPG